MEKAFHRPATSNSARKCRPGMFGGTPARDRTRVFLWTHSPFVDEYEWCHFQWRWCFCGPYSGLCGGRLDRVVGKGTKLKPAAC
eukprot:48461-Eustigmatos_ZCMA.PRE.1